MVVDAGGELSHDSLDRMFSFMHPAKGTIHKHLHTVDGRNPAPPGMYKAL